MDIKFLLNHYFSQNSSSEKTFDIQNNDFGRKHLPTSNMAANTVYLISTAMLKNFYNYLAEKVYRSPLKANWRGKPLTSLAVILELIRGTTTKTGLKVRAELDEKIYQTGIKINDEDFQKINIERNEFHSEWNYIIYPNHIFFEFCFDMSSMFAYFAASKQ